MRMSRDIVSEARSLCTEIAGEYPEDECEVRGSIEIMAVLMDEVLRLRKEKQFHIGKFTLYNECDSYSGKDVIVIMKPDGESGCFDPVTLEVAIANYFNAN